MDFEFFTWRLRISNLALVLFFFAWFLDRHDPYRVGLFEAVRQGSVLIYDTWRDSGTCSASAGVFS